MTSYAAIAIGLVLVGFTGLDAAAAEPRTVEVGGLVAAGIAGNASLNPNESVAEPPAAAPALPPADAAAPESPAASGAPVAPLPDGSALPPGLEAAVPGVPTVGELPGVLPGETPGDPAVDATAGLRDPFRPFTLDLQPKKIAEDEFLTPLQRYDLAQLTVVGVLLDLEPPRAMLQDDLGMGYIVTPGTLIGRQHGIVTDVQPRQIIVEETYVDFYGREQVRKAVLVMPEEDEEVGPQAGRATGKAQ